MLKRNFAVVVIAALVLGVGAYAWAEGAPPGPTTTSPSADAEVIVKDKTGAYVTVTFDKGKVAHHSDTSITLDRPDGQPVTLALDSSTTYRGIKSNGEIRDGTNAIVLSKGGTATVVIQRPEAARGNTATPASVERTGDQVPAA
jgi:hypothetical protein